MQEANTLLSRKRRLRAFALAAILLAGALLRLASAADTRAYEPLAGDATQYFLYAYNLKYFSTFSKDPGDPPGSGQGIRPDAARSPGYPLFLSLFVDGGPDRALERRVALAQALLGILTLVAAFFLFSALLPPGWDLAALLATALSPHLIIMGSYILSETLFTLLLTCALLALARLLARPSPGRAALCGALLALACLVRPTLVPFGLICGLAPLLRERTKQAAAYGLLLVAALILFISPWTLRNQSLAARPWANENLVNFLHFGLYPDMRYQDDPETFGWPTTVDPRAAEIHRSLSCVLSEIARRFRTEPGRHFVWFFLKKPLYFWGWSMLRGAGPFVFRVDSSPYLSSPLFKASHSAMHLFHWPLVFLGLFASLWVWARGFPGARDEAARALARLLSALLLLYTAMHMVGLPESRYALPLKPALYGMAMLCAHGGLVWMKKRREAA